MIVKGIAKLEFDSKLDILAMFSTEGEKIKLSQKISTADARGAVEKWLLQVQDVMVLSLHDVIAASKDVYKQKIRHEWVLEWPGQVVLCISQMYVPAFFFLFSSLQKAFF